MAESWVRWERRGAVLEITLQKPKVNAICRTMSRELYEAACLLQNDDSLHVGLLTADGDRTFSAGWDFNEVMASAADGRKPLEDAFDQDACDGGFGGITSLRTLRKPLVAAINGAAVGGGFELALACDLIVMAEHAYFQLPEMQRGFLPDGGGIQRLPRRIPHNVAVEMILTGRRMEAVEARHWGLVRTVCEAGDLVRHAREVADEIAKGAPLALQAFKEVLAAIDGMPVAEAMDFQRSDALDLPLYRKMAASDDAIEGPRAFLERRRPNWKGR